MMHLVQKWLVTIGDDPELTARKLYISDDYLSNVLRKLSDIEFIPPEGVTIQWITIRAVPSPVSTTGAQTTTASS